MGNQGGFDGFLTTQKMQNYEFGFVPRQESSRCALGKLGLAASACLPVGRLKYSLTP
jgi:hypothetical protein